MNKDQRPFWEKHLFQLEENGPYYMRLQHAGKRRTIKVGSNRAHGAARAVEIYRAVSRGGWEALEQKRRAKDANGITIGGFLEKVLPTVKGARTRGDYQRSLHRIAADLKGIPANFGNPAARREKIDRLPLALIDATAITKWREKILKSAGNSIEWREGAEIRAQRIIRNAKSLFSPKRLKAANLQGLVTNPFTEYGTFRYEICPYRSRFKAHGFTMADMIRRAREEWGGIEATLELHREAYKCLILLAYGALRKKEADMIPWSHFDPIAGTLKVDSTEHFTPKANSRGIMEIGPAATKALSAFRRLAHDDVFILRGLPAVATKGHAWYRAARTFDFLNEWIKGYEHNGEKPFAEIAKPIHELRKEKGAQILTTHEKNIFAAKQFLRHASVTTTEKYYAEYLNSISGDLGVEEL